MSFKYLFFAIASLLAGAVYISAGFNFNDEKNALRRNGIKTKVVSISNIEQFNKRTGLGAVASSLLPQYQAEVTFADRNGKFITGNLRFSGEVYDYINNAGNTAIVFYDSQNQAKFIFEKGDEGPEWFMVALGVFFLLLSNGYFRKIKARNETGAVP